MKRLKRITVNPSQMGGVHTIRGLRIPVSTVAGIATEGMTKAQILKAYPDLDLDDISAALRYAAENLLVDLTKEQLDGIRQSVKNGIASIEAGRFTECEGRDGLRKFMEKVKKRGSTRLKKLQRRTRSK